MHFHTLIIGNLNRLGEISRPGKYSGEIPGRDINRPGSSGKSVSPGWDVRLESETVVGAGWEFEKQVLQLSLFKKDIGQKRGNNERRGMGTTAPMSHLA